MKTILMLTLAAFCLSSAPSYASVSASTMGVSAAKVAGTVLIGDKDYSKKQKRKRKHTGLDDGPNHQ